MLGVFKTSVRNTIVELKSVQSEASRPSGADVLKQFKALHPGSMNIEFNEDNMIAITHSSESVLHPRQFGAVDDIFCIFSGNIHNLAQLRSLYGLSKNITEVHLVIEVYKVLRDRAPYPVDQVLRDLKGSFVFSLYDSKANRVFVAADAHFSVPFYWGFCKNGVIAFSDNPTLIKRCCGNSFSAFPKGCFFSSIEGLFSYENPLDKLTELSHVDSQGQLCSVQL